MEQIMLFVFGVLTGILGLWVTVLIVSLIMNIKEERRKYEREKENRDDK